MWTRVDRLFEALLIPPDLRLDEALEAAAAVFVNGPLELALEERVSFEQAIEDERQ